MSLKMNSSFTYNKRRRKSKCLHRTKDDDDKVKTYYNHNQTDREFNFEEDQFKNDDNERIWSVKRNKHSTQYDNQTTNNCTTSSTIYSTLRRSRPNHKPFYDCNVDSLSLPMMLYQRQTSLYWRNHNRFRVNFITRGERERQVNRKHSNQKIISSSNNNNRKDGKWNSPYASSFYNKRSQWNTFLRRSLQFNQLNTPITDAILGLDRSGSFLISIGDNHNLSNRNQYIPNDDNHSCHDQYPLLYLRFYGVLMNLST